MRCSLSLESPGHKKETDLEQKIEEMETIFNETQLPVVPVRLNPHSTVLNVEKFIQTHLLTVKANTGNRTFEPYLNRLYELKQVLTTKSN